MAETSALQRSLAFRIGLAAFTVLLAVAMACASPDTESGAGETPNAQPQRLTQIGGFRMPESARYDRELDVWFVSNIGGDPGGRANAGSISVVDSAGNVSTLVRGGAAGVTLHSPKGLAITGDTLWVVDAGAVRGFHRRTGAPVATVDFASTGASFLNDIAAGANGELYVTDSGIRPDMSPSGTAALYRVTGRSISLVSRDSALALPNGVAYDSRNSRLVLAPMSGAAVQTIGTGDAAPQSLASGPGEYDGIEVLDDGRVLVSSWKDSSVYVLREGSLHRLISGVGSPADIGYDPVRRRLAIPRLLADTVEIWTIP